MRGSKPGERRGGRQIGTPNKRTLEVRERLAELNCDPIQGMALIAMDPEATLELRGRMFAELAAYIAPKRKAVELSGADGAPISVQQHERIDVAVLDRDQRDQLRALLMLARAE